MGALAYPEFDMIAAEVLAEHGNGDTPTVEEEPESDAGLIRHVS